MWLTGQFASLAGHGQLQSARTGHSYQNVLQLLERTTR